MKKIKCQFCGQLMEAKEKSKNYHICPPIKNKKIYVLLYQGEVDGVFTSKKAIEQFRKDNEIEKNVFKEEFEAIKTSLYEK